MEGSGNLIAKIYLTAYNLDDTEQKTVMFYSLNPFDRTNS